MPYNKRPWDRGFKNHPGDKPRFNARCADCGESCDVPFKPTGAKPVYCRSCFKKHEAGSEIRTWQKDGRSFDAREKRLFKTDCASCGDTCEVPFKPNGSKPVYCRACFDKGGSNDRRRPEPRADHGEQFRTLNAKLDEILKTLAAMGTVQAEAAPEAVEAEEKPKKAKKATKAPAKKKPAAKKSATKKVAKKK